MSEFGSGADVNSKPTWIWFDNVRNRLIALPQDKHIGTSRYQLRATDSKGAFTDVDMSFMVHNKTQETITQVRSCPLFITLVFRFLLLNEDYIMSPSSYCE